MPPQKNTPPAPAIWCAAGVLIHTYFWGIYLHALTLSGPGLVLYALTLPHAMLFGPLMLLIEGACALIFGAPPIR